MTLQDAILQAYQLFQSGRHVECETICRSVLAQIPNQPDALHLLGGIAFQCGQTNAAIDLLQQAIAGAPTVERYSNLGNMLLAGGKPLDAISAFRHAVALRPDHLQSQQELTNALLATGHPQEALSLFSAVAHFWPNDAAAVNHLGYLLLANDRLDEAIAAAQKASTLQPDHFGPHNNLAHILQSRGQATEALPHYDRAAALRPDLAMVASNRLMVLHLVANYGAHALLREHRLWDQRFAQPLKSKIRPHLNDRSPNRKLRIGYVSPDLHNHVIGWNFLPILRHHDRAQFEVFCYAAAIGPDHVTQQLQQSSNAWRNISILSDDQAADLIRDDRIDILIDLAMHSVGNRLLVFAQKPAPVQVTYLGYAGTTGLEAIDYRLSDPYLDPPDSDLSCYSEQTIRLPNTFWCYTPGGPAPDVQPAPALSQGSVTFGCLCNSAKYSPHSLDLWGQLLAQTPGSNLLLQCSSESQHGLSAAACNLRQAKPPLSESRPIASYSSAASLLTGTWPPTIESTSPLIQRPMAAPSPLATVCGWGVPIVTLCGATAVGRAGRSILSNVGLSELTADTPAEYVRIASDWKRLIELRPTLRERMRNSPLMNTAQFTRDLEVAYCRMWRHWTEQTKLP